MNEKNRESIINEITIGNRKLQKKMKKKRSRSRNKTTKSSS